MNGVDCGFVVALGLHMSSVDFQRLDHKQWISAALFNQFSEIHAVSVSGGWVIKGCLAGGARSIYRSARGEYRVFAKLDTLASFLGGYGVYRFRVVCDPEFQLEIPF